MVLDLIHTLVAVQTELAAMAPALLAEAMEELLLGMLDGWAQVLLQRSPAASPGGMLQLWLEGNFVLAALAGMGSDALAQAYSRLRTALDSRLEEALVAAEDGAQAAAFAAWAQGCSNARLAVPTCQRRLEGMLEEVQVAACSNLTSLRQLAASTC